MPNTGGCNAMGGHCGAWCAGRGSTGTLRVGVSVYWQRGHKEPWILLSDLPAGYARVATYRRRARCEAMYEDCKTRGWQMEATKLRDHNRLNRLLMAVWVAVWWMQPSGMAVIHYGVRRRYDRRERREMRVQQLGRCHHCTLLDGGRPPPYPFTASVISRALPGSGETVRERRGRGWRDTPMQWYGTSLRCRWEKITRHKREPRDHGRG